METLHHDGHAGVSELKLHPPVQGFRQKEAADRRGPGWVWSGCSSSYVLGVGTEALA